ncbi:two-component response regulator ARR17-like [Primulina huaijiensis]|uniref:two-component response regulator ARR17-like n=1 Tax=Primulina huaijiensis TaxID=1492673 RepID=UPI003CC78E0B
MENSEEAHELKTEQKIKHRFHVLAVDDSQIDRKLLERLLTVSSYQVTCVESGDKALEYLGLLDIQEENEYETPSLSTASKPQVSKINLIITDYNMPGISGYDLLKRVKDSSWKDVPVVVMSSENVPSRINKCMEGGAEEFLLKPVTLSDLSKLHSHLLNSITHYPPCDKDEQEEDEQEDAIVNSVVNSNKRKATSSEPSERRPRVKNCMLPENTRVSASLTTGGSNII